MSHSGSRPHPADRHVPSNGHAAADMVFGLLAPGAVADRPVRQPDAAGVGATGPAR